MKYIIYGGGPSVLVPDIGEIYERHGRNVKWIGVDRGAFKLAAAGISMEKAVGDFDSVTDTEWTAIKEAVKDLDIYPPEKNETDLELAVSYVKKQKPEKIVIVGGTGGRIDHFLSAVHLMETNGDNIMIEDKYNRMRAFEAGTYVLSPSLFPYISFLPSSDKVKNLTLKGLRYPLYQQNLNKNSTLCISNEWKEQTACVSFDEGRLLLVESRDME